MTMRTALAKQSFRLGQCLERIVDNRGKTPPLSDVGIELLEVNAIESGRRSPNFENVRKFVSKETYTTWFRAGHPKAGDTLISTVGAIGRVSFVREARGCIAQNVIALRPKAEILDPEFLYYYLASSDTQQRLSSLNIGVAQPSLKVPHLLSLEIELPPLPVQRRIARILSAYDELMENNQRRIRILEGMARALHREWFVHYRFPGHERKDCSVGFLGEICDLARDAFDDAADSELPLLDLAHIPSRSLAPQETGNACELTTSRIVFRQGDTLFGAIRSYLHKVVIAPYPGVTNVSVLVLRPKRPEFRAMLSLIASSADTIRWTDQHSSGTKMPVINGSVFMTMPVSVPALSLAAQFEKAAGPMLDKLCLLSVGNQNLRRTRDLLLPRLLSGQIEVQAH